MKRITVCTTDQLLWRRIQLLLEDRYEVNISNGTDAADGIVIVDLDTLSDVKGDILLSRRGGEGIVRIPFSFTELEKEVEKSEKRDTGRLILINESRSVKLFGEVIRLTEVEFRLLSALVSAPVGEFVSRERLINEVWGGESDCGVVNVYIHYLRTKLEHRGEKVIISSRREGYKLDERIGR